MFYNLYKYDLKEMLSSLWKLGLVVLGMTLISGLTLRFIHEGNWFLTLSLMAEFLLVFAFWILVLVTLVLHFNNHCFGKQGYLTFTLPVTSWQILLAEMLAAFTVVILCGLFFFLLIGLVFGLNLTGTILTEVSPFYAEMMHTLAYWLPDLLHALLSGVLGILASLAEVYLAMSIGQLFINYRVAASFVAFFVLDVLTSVVQLLCAFPASSSLGAILGSFDLSSLVILLACFFGSVYIMDRHLNLK